MCESRTFLEIKNALRGCIAFPYEAIRRSFSMNGIKLFNDLMEYADGKGASDVCLLYTSDAADEL